MAIPVIRQSKFVVTKIDHAAIRKSKVFDNLPGVESWIACHSVIIEFWGSNATTADMTLGKIRQLCICLACVLALPVLTDAPDLTGDWELDEELTKKLEPPVRTNRDFGRGLRNAVLPVPGGPGAQNPNAASLKQPLVLDCVGLTLSKIDKTVEIECDNGSEREFHVGNRHGRRTTWRGKRLTESYRSTSRSVKHLFTLDRNDNMIVTVTIKPQGGVAQKHVRAFNRVTESENPEPDASDSTDRN